MKSERRHELEKNVLADRLASGIESTRSYLPLILGGLGVVLIAAIGWGIYSSFAQRKASVAWTEFYFNLTRGDADSFVDLAEEYPRSAAAGWARQIAGDNYLQRGISALYSDKAQARELIGKAIDAFEEVDRQTNNPDLRAKSLLGLAQAYESLGDVDKAVSYYQQLSKATSQLGIVAEANERLAFLTSQAGKDFYAWFSKLDPKPDAPITLPSDMQLPPTTPDLQFGPTDTELNSSIAPPAQSSVDTSAAPDLPAAGEVPEITQDAPGTEPPFTTQQPPAQEPAATEPPDATQEPDTTQEPAATQQPAPAATEAQEAAPNSDGSANDLPELELNP